MLDWLRQGLEFLACILLPPALMIYLRGVIGRIVDAQPQDDRVALDPNSLDLLQLAYLSEKSRRVADTILVALVAGGNASLSENGEKVSLAPSHSELLPAIQPLARLFGTGTVTPDAFERRIRSALLTIRAELQRLGLVRSESRVIQFRLLATVTFVILASLLLWILSFIVRDAAWLAGILMAVMSVGLLVMMARENSPAGDRLVASCKEQLAPQLRPERRWRPTPGSTWISGHQSIRGHLIGEMRCEICGNTGSFPYRSSGPSDLRTLTCACDLPAPEGAALCLAVALWGLEVLEGGPYQAMYMARLREETA